MQNSSPPPELLFSLPSTPDRLPPLSPAVAATLLTSSPRPPPPRRPHRRAGWRRRRRRRWRRGSPASSWWRSCGRRRSSRRPCSSARSHCASSSMSTSRSTARAAPPRTSRRPPRRPRPAALPPADTLRWRPPPLSLTVAAPPSPPPSPPPPPSSASSPEISRAWPWCWPWPSGRRSSWRSLSGTAGRTAGRTTGCCRCWSCYLVARSPTSVNTSDGGVGRRASGISRGVGSQSPCRASGTVSVMGSVMVSVAASVVVSGVSRGGISRCVGRGVCWGISNNVGLCIIHGDIRLHQMRDVLYSHPSTPHPLPPLDPLYPLPPHTSLPAPPLPLTSCVISLSRTTCASTSSSSLSTVFSCCSRMRPWARVVAAVFFRPNSPLPHKPTRTSHGAFWFFVFFHNKVAFATARFISVVT